MKSLCNKGVEIEEKIKEINNDEDVSKLKKFSIPKTFVKSIHYDGGKIRTFNELRIAVLNENTEAIEEFCTKGKGKIINEFMIFS